MKKNYNHKKIEKIVQKQWKKKNYFKTIENYKLKKYYCLSMIPYPSGYLHIGHVRNYTIGDIIARYKRLNNKNVLHPIGWDAFGLPAENAALKNNLDPHTWTKKNIKYMKKQLKKLGISYDWNKEITTCDPKYYKWEQWLFLKLYKKKLVYKKKSIVNWCPNDKTVLANEQVIQNKCWRCNTIIKNKYISQWFIKTKKYAKQLLNDLKYLNNWPENVKNMQKQWIGKSKGIKITLKINEFKYKIKIYTNNKFKSILKTICISISKTHKIIKNIKKINNKIKNLIKILKKKQNKKYLGFNTKINAINPINNKLIPIWITNFTEEQYNTNEIFVTNENKIQDIFIKKYKLQNKKKLNNKCLSKKKLKTNKLKKLFHLMKKQKLIKKKINYKIKDWVISRQRFWGVPIPIIKFKKSIIPVKNKELPVLLPKNDNDIKNNLKKNVKWKTYILNNKYATRETDTFDTFLESSWYYARCTSPNYKKSIFNKKKANYWLPIDTYIGGIEHATMHLIYFRLIHKIMKDMNLLKNKEPAKTIICQGMVLSDTFYFIEKNKKKWINFSNIKKNKKNKFFIFKDNKKIEIIYDGINKMSKSKNNGVNPNEIIKKYGADTLRLFIIFSAPIEKNLYWIEDGINGCFKFIKKLWKIVLNFRKIKIPKNNIKNKNLKNIKYLLNKLIYDVTNIIKQKLYLNTAISKIMKFIKHIKHHNIKEQNSYIFFKKCINTLLIILYPFIPHISFYLWHKMKNKKNIDKIKWPKISKKQLKQEINIQIAIQINGKTRKKINIKNTYNKNKIILKIYKLNLLKNYFVNKNKIKNIIYIKNKVINFVIK